MNKIKDRRFQCCICLDTFSGYGNNPEPFPYNSSEEKCCNRCDDAFVIPVRILRHSLGKPMRKAREA